MTDGMEVWAAGLRDKDDMTKRTEQATGTPHCPVCGKDTPHGHGQEELLSVILELRQRIEAPSLPVEEKTTGWISVKDRLPGAEFEWVLVAAEFDAPGDWRIKIGALNRDMSTGWKILGASWTPTHWMPLPCAPDMKSSQVEEGPTDPMENWLMRGALEWLEQAEHIGEKERCKNIAVLLRTLWRGDKQNLQPVTAGGSHMKGGEQK